MLSVHDFRMQGNIYLLLDKLEPFLRVAIGGNIEFHRDRKELYEGYTACISLIEPEESAKFIAISDTLHASIVGCLNTKQDQLQNDAKLAYITGIGRINTLVVRKYGIRKMRGEEVEYRPKIQGEALKEEEEPKLESVDGLRKKLQDMRLGASNASQRVKDLERQVGSLSDRLKQTALGAELQEHQLLEFGEAIFDVASNKEEHPEVLVKKILDMTKSLGKKKATFLFTELEISRACASNEAAPKIAEIAKGGNEPKQTTTLSENQQVTNPQDSEVTPTVTHGDNVGKEQSGLLLASSIAPLSEGIDPYPSQNLEAVLGRQYLVDTFAWASTDARGALKHTTSFPNALFLMANIREKLDHYQFFRAGVEVTVRLNGTAFHQGALQVAWVPHYSTAALSANGILYEQSIETLSNCPNSILSANTNATISFVIPYCAPSRFWNLKDSPASGQPADGWMGKAFFSVLAPLLQGGVGSTPTLTVNIFARFVDITVSGATLRDASLLQKDLTKDELMRRLEELTYREIKALKMKTEYAQEGLKSKACAAMLPKSIKELPNGRTMENLIKKFDQQVKKKLGPEYAGVVIFAFAQDVPLIQDKLKKFMNGGNPLINMRESKRLDAVNFVGEELSRSVSSQPRRYKNPTPIRKTRKVRYAAEDDEDEEMDIKTEFKDMGKKVATGLKKSVKRTVVDLSSLGIDAVTSLLDSGLGALADKPTDNAPPVKQVPDLYGNFPNCDGLDAAVKLAVSPTNKVSNDPSLYGQTRDYNRFENYKMLPGIVAMGTWASGDAQEFREFVLPVTPTVSDTLTLSGSDVLFYLSHLGNLASFHRHWTGSIKYHLMIFTNKYTTGRLVIKHIPDPTFNSAITNSVFGDTFSHQIDVTGDTSYSFTIPYLAQTSWLRVADPNLANTAPVTTWGWANGQIAAYVMAPLANGNGSTPVAHWVLYMAGGPDFRVAGPVNPWVGYGDGTGLLTVDRPTKSEKRTAQNDAERRKLEEGWRELGEKNKNKACSTFVADPIPTGVDLSVNPRALFEQPFPTFVETKVTIQKDVQMGEEVESWSQLMRRYVLFCNMTGHAYGSGVYLQILMHQYATGRTKDNNGTFPTYRNGFCLFSRAMRCFHFHRGAVRLKGHFYNIGAGDPNYFAVPTVTADITSPDITNVPEKFSEGAVVQQAVTRRGLEVELPYYCAYDMICNCLFLGETELPYFTIGVNDSITSSANTFAANIYVAAGDDFSMGWPMTPVVVAKLFAPEEDIDYSKRLPE